MNAIYNTCPICCAAVDPNAATHHANWHEVLAAKLLELDRKLASD